MGNCPLKAKEKREDAGWWLSLSRGPFKPQPSWPGLTRPSIFFERFSRRGMDARVKPAHDDSVVFRTVPAPRSSVKNAAARPGHGAYVSTSPVLEPLAAESLRPWGSAKYDS